jgi:hypothetical protein
VFFNSIQRRDRCFSGLEPSSVNAPNQHAARAVAGRIPSVLFDAAEGPEMQAAASKIIEWIPKGYSGTIGPQNSHRECVGAENKITKSIVEDFVRRFGGAAEGGRGSQPRLD